MSIEETVQHIIASQENNRKIYDDNKKKNYKNKPRSNARKAEHQKYEAETNLASKDKKNNDDDNDDNNMIKEFVKERPNTNNVSKQLHKTNKRHSAYTNRFANSEHERESHQNNNVISLPSSPSYSMSSTSPTYTSSLSLASHSAARKAQVSNSHALLLDEVSEQYNLFKYLCQEEHLGTPYAFLSSHYIPIDMNDRHTLIQMYYHVNVHVFRFYFGEALYQLHETHNKFNILSKFSFLLPWRWWAKFKRVSSARSNPKSQQNITVKQIDEISKESKLESSHVLNHSEHESTKDGNGRVNSNNDNTTIHSDEYEKKNIETKLKLSEEQEYESQETNKVKVVEEDRGKEELNKYNSSDKTNENKSINNKNEEKLHQEEYEQLKESYSHEDAENSDIAELIAYLQSIHLHNAKKECKEWESWIINKECRGKLCHERDVLLSVCRSISKMYSGDGGVVIHENVPLSFAVQQCYGLTHELLQNYTTAIFSYEHRLSSHLFKELKDYESCVMICRMLSSLWCDTSELFLCEFFMEGCRRVNRWLEDGRVHSELYGLIFGEVLKPRWQVQLDEMQRAIKPNSSNSNAPIASLYTSPTSNLFTSMESPMTCEPLANDLIHTERSKTASSPPVSPLLRRPHTANENNVKSGEHQTTISVNMDHENNNNNNFNKTKEQANTSAHGIMCSNALFHRRFAMSFPTLMRQLARIAVHIGYNESINDALEVFYARMYVQCAEIQRKAIYYSKVTDTDVNRANNHRKKEQKQEEQKEEEEVKRQREGEMVSEKVKQETQNEKNTNIIEQASEHVQEIHEEQSECTTTSSNEECNDNHSYCHSNNNNNTIHGKLQETSEGETDEVMLVPNDKCTFTHSESQPAKRTLVHSLSQMMFSLPTSQPTLSPSPLSPSSSSQTGVKTTSMKEKKVHNQQQQQQQQQLGSVNIDFFALDEMCLLFDMLPSAWSKLSMISAEEHEWCDKHLISLLQALRFVATTLMKTSNLMHQV